MTIMTVDWLARESLMILQSNLVATLLFDRNYEADFTGTEARGDTVRLRRRDRGNAQEFTGTISSRGLQESTVPLQLEKHYDASFEITSKELTLSLDNFSSQVLEPQIVSIAELIDAYALSKLYNLPYWANLGASFAAQALPTTIGGFAQMRKVNNDTKVPMAGRVALWDPTAEAAMLSIDAFVTAEKKGDEGTALREASLGRVMGYDHFMGQNVGGGTPLTNAALADGSGLVNNVAGYAVGSTSIVADAVTISYTFPAGTPILVGGYKYALAANAVSDGSGNVTFVLAEGIRTPLADNDVIVAQLASGGTSYYRRGALFHPRAFAFASVPLVVPPGAASGATISDGGLSLRVIQGYDTTSKKAIISIDCLVGARMVDGSLGAQVISST